MLDKIERIKIDIPEQELMDLINYLGHFVSWNFVFDLEREDAPHFFDIINDNESVTDAGLGVMTFTSYQTDGVRPDYKLNLFGEKIFEYCKEKSNNFKSKRVSRIYWNLYSRSSVCKFHVDNPTPNKYVSILYNIHENDGGTAFTFEDKNIIIKAEKSEAVIFPSNVLHKGVGPTKNKWRFSLNIVVELEDGKNSSFIQ